MAVEHKVMTPEEYSRFNISGWHLVCKNADGFGNMGIRYIDAEASDQWASGSFLL